MRSEVDFNYPIPGIILMLYGCFTYNCAGITKQDIYYGVISLDTGDKVVEGLAVT